LFVGRVRAAAVCCALVKSPVTNRFNSRRCAYLFVVICAERFRADSACEETNATRVHNKSSCDESAFVRKKFVCEEACRSGCNDGGIRKN
jgi:hypothetical protein